MKVLHIVAVAALALGLTQMAYANHDGKDDGHCDRMKHGMMDADTNKDGVISKDEFMASHQARANKMFDMMDANHDGKIDQAERDTMKGKMKDHKMGDMDHGPDHK